MNANDNFLQGESLAVIVVAAGSGSRMGAGVPKQFLPLGGVPVLVRTVRRLREILPLAQFTVVLPEAHIAFWEELCAQWGLTGTHRVCIGGAERTDSVLRALEETDECAWIAVHDGVRPLFPDEMIRRVLAEAAAHGNAVPAVQPVDTFRLLTPDGSQNIARTSLRAIQTPQVFRAETLRRAYAAVGAGAFTDDASVVEQWGEAIHLCEGEPRNIKITRPEDIALAEALLNR